jgi:hypothetical protein
MGTDGQKTAGAETGSGKEMQKTNDGKSSVVPWIRSTETHPQILVPGSPNTAQAAKLPPQVQVDVEQVQEFIYAQKEAIQLYKKKHVLKRETSLEGLAKALAGEEGSNSQEKDIKWLQFVNTIQLID